MQSLTLTHPPSCIEGIWKGVWFDIAHQHFLVHRENEYCLWSQNLSNFQPRFFYGDTLISPNTEILYVKLSLDKQLLAVQISQKAFIVLDTKLKKKYSITIKSHDENKILPEGFVWSEHGGNSQDLIIVTTQGLELYKISTSRMQCKLSRTISKSCHSFWYEPNYRMMLIATMVPAKNSPLTSSSQSTLHDSNYSLSMNGFFFRSEKSDTLQLELPPPEKCPKFELGPGALVENIALVSIYSTLCCVSLQNADEGDFAVIYSISKTTVTRTHILALDCASKSINISVLDNLLIFHCMDLKVTLLFDVMARPSKMNINGNSIEKIDAVCAPSMLVLPSVDETPVSKEAIVNEVNGEDRTEKRNLSSSADQEDDDDEGSWDAVGGQRDKDAASSENLKIRSRSNSSASNTANRKQQMALLVLSNLSSSSTPVVADLYDRSRWKLLSPAWIWDKIGLKLRRIHLNLDQIVSNIQDHKRYMAFLVRRGQPFTAPRPVYTHLYDEDDVSPEAKRLILSKVLTALESRIGVSWLEVLFKAMTVPYANEQQRLDAEMMAEEERESNITNRSSRLSTTSFSMSKERESFARTLSSSSSSMTSSNSSRSSIASHATGNMSAGTSSLSSSAMDHFLISSITSEPLEPSYPLHIFLPDITAVSSRLKMNSSGDSKSVIQSNQLQQYHELQQSPIIPLTTRRDALGNLIVLQIETLSYVWLPFVMSSNTNLDYCGWSLSNYIATLRGANLAVHSTLSMLLLHIFAAQGKYLQIARLLQMQFFPDVSEVAMAALELSDIITDTELMQKQQQKQEEQKGSESSIAATNETMSNVNNESYLVSAKQLGIKSAVKALQQVGLDMLWRLQERPTVIRWLLGHGRVMEAINLCMKRRGKWRTGLSPASIPAAEFFTSAVLGLNAIDKEYEDDEIELSLSTMSPLFMSSSSSNCYSTELESYEGQKVEILHTVYVFIREWDSAILNILPSTGKSKLASLTTFPAQCFSPELNEKFQAMFGFQVEKM